MESPHAIVGRMANKIRSNMFILLVDFVASDRCTYFCFVLGAQEIRTHNQTTGGQDVTLRRWNRIPTTEEHLAALDQAR